MRRALVVVGVLLALGGGAIGAAAAFFALVPTEEPVRYAVVKGDTLFVIAKAHGVTVDQLRDWNAVEGDLIEVGQVLLIWPPEADVPVAGAPGEKKPRRRAAVAASGAIDGEAPLVLPPERPCLAGPTEADLAGDQAIAVSRGLDYEQVRSAMGGFVHHTLRCFPPESPSGVVRLGVTIACSGRVAGVEVEDDGGMPEEAIACVRDTLRYAPFPAHDMPDGYRFDYPLRFEAP